MIFIPPRYKSDTAGYMYIYILYIIYIVTLCRLRSEGAVIMLKLQLGNGRVFPQCSPHSAAPDPEPKPNPLLVS